MAKTECPYAWEEFATRGPWIESRRTFVGASESVVLVAPKAAYSGQSAYRLWAVKSGLAPDLDDSLRLRVGRVLEPLALAEWQRETGRTAAPLSFSIARNRARPYLACTPDGVVYAKDAADHEGVECKALRDGAQEEWESGPPMKFLVQCQHGMAVTGWRRWHLAVLFGNDEFRTYPIERHERFIGLLVARVAEFWQRVLDGNPPPTDCNEGTTRTLRELFPAEEPGLRVHLPPRSLVAHRRLLHAKRRLKTWQQVHDHAPNELVAMLGGAEVGVLPEHEGEYHHKTKARRGYTVPDSTTRPLTFVERRHET